MQTTEPELAKALRRFPDCRRVGFSVAGAWVQLFALPYTLAWVAKNVVEKITPGFPGENEGPKTGIGAGQAGKGGERQTAPPCSVGAPERDRTIVNGNVSW